MSSHGMPWRIRAIGAALLTLGFAASAQAQSDFVEFYYNAGVNAHFYYSPSSVQSNGSIRTVAWTSTDMMKANNGTEHLTYHAQIDCSAQTIESLWVDRLDAQTGTLIGDGGPTRPLGPRRLHVGDNERLSRRASLLNDTPPHRTGSNTDQLLSPFCSLVKSLPLRL